MDINPDRIVQFTSSGISDMGDVTDEGSVARFTLDAPRFVPVYIRGKWTNIGSVSSGSATLSFKIDHRSTGGLCDFTLLELPKMGTDTSADPPGRPDLNLRFREDELYTWLFNRGEYLVAEWANPDSPYIRWALEVGLYATNNA